MKRELLTVTAEDIALAEELIWVDGELGVTNMCPVALALKRQTGEESVFVGLCFLRCGDRAATTTRALRKFLDAFDDRKAVEPQRFWVRWQERGKSDECHGASVCV